MKPLTVKSPPSGPASRSTEPRLQETIKIVAVTGMLFISFICIFTNYFTKIDNFGDSLSYMDIAAAIRHWNFQGLIIEHFWGLSYLMAALSIVTRVSDRTALLVVCIASSFVAVVLAHRLWGGWVAGLFAVLNFDWMQRSFLGGSEPLFVALLFGSLLSVRRGRWLPAALLAALATVVRPLGFLALVAIGVTLLWKREFRHFALATAIGVAVGGLYALPLALNFGSPLANVHGYNPNGTLFGIPFYAIIKGTILYSSPWTNLIFTFGWIFLVLAGVVAMVATDTYRAYARNFPVEAIFAALYLVAIFCYNYPHWARGNFPRFVIPVVPFVLLALQRWVPKDRRFLWMLAALMPLLAAASAIGVRNVAAGIRHIVG
jgi:GNAT superfamily N-acetyltransferase